MPFVSAFLVGLFATLHCVGMCGGIIGAATLSLPQEVQQSRWRILPFVSAYNLGRISSYTLAGALMGALGQSITSLSPQYGHFILQGLAALFMVAIGLYLAGWFPRFARVEQLGKPVWRRLEPIGQKLLPVRTPGRAFWFGMVWGWLPCGLVYTVLIWTSSTGSALAGALFMLAFGAGTLPTVMTAGILSGWIVRFSRNQQARRWIGLLIIIMGLASIYLALEHKLAVQIHAH